MTAEAEKRLKEIRERCAMATRGPWKIKAGWESKIIGPKSVRFEVGLIHGTSFDEEFISKSREDLPFLLSEAERWRGLARGLAEKLMAAKRNHLVVDGDCWFSCPASGECCQDDAKGCNCGADTVNAEIDKALEDFERAEGNR